ncbi:hypothetical protein Tco_0682250 [Tanacetum coccineum]|uniref:Uncharacterized protein n=1 Tax=Tanacetum coccineum TaxID=301880 RepID=A0ABQ4XRQ4_9ASTR
MYLTASRPDIMFAVCLCARFQVTPKVSHLHAVKRIFRYLKHQPKLGLWYPKDSPFHLEVFSDSDYAGDIMIDHQLQEDETQYLEEDQPFELAYSLMMKITLIAFLSKLFGDLPQSTLATRSANSAKGCYKSTPNSSAAPSQRTASVHGTVLPSHEKVMRLKKVNIEEKEASNERVGAHRRISDFWRQLKVLARQDEGNCMTKLKHLLKTPQRTIPMDSIVRKGDCLTMERDAKRPLKEKESYNC